MGGYTGADTEQLGTQGTALQRVGRDLVRSGRALHGEAERCAGSASGQLAGTLDRFAAAAQSYAREIGTHVDAVGFLAANIATDLSAADGGFGDPYGIEGLGD